MGLSGFGKEKERGRKEKRRMGKGSKKAMKGRRDYMGVGWKERIIPKFWHKSPPLVVSKSLDKI
jgi:hypothetical protein